MTIYDLLNEFEEAVSEYAFKGNKDIDVIPHIEQRYYKAKKHLKEAIAKLIQKEL